MNTIGITLATTTKALMIVACETPLISRSAKIHRITDAQITATGVAPEPNAGMYEPRFPKNATKNDTRARIALIQYPHAELNPIYEPKPSLA